MRFFIEIFLSSEVCGVTFRGVTTAEGGDDVIMAEGAAAADAAGSAVGGED